MHSDHELATTVRGWLRAEDDVSAAPIVDEVVALLDEDTEGVVGHTRRLVGLDWIQVGAVAAVLVITLAGAVVLPAFDPGNRPTASPVSSASSIAYVPVETGPRDVTWEGGRVGLVLPFGWSEAVPHWYAYEACIEGACWAPPGDVTFTRYATDTGNPLLAVSVGHDVRRVALDACAGPRAYALGPLGTSAEDLAAALSTMRGVTRTGPTSLTIGGFPATRFDLALDGPCPAGDNRPILVNATSLGFALRPGAAGRVYLVDVDGRLLVLTSIERGAPADAVAELEAIIGSLEIEPRAGGPEPTATNHFLQSESEGTTLPARRGLTVAGIRLSVDSEAPLRIGGQSWGSNGFTLGRDTVGSQGAEAAILWTSYPDPSYPFPCEAVIGDVGPTVDDLAAAMAAAAEGSADLAGPVDVTLGGRPARRLSFSVTGDVGCQPGYFYSWPDIYGGALWPALRAGDHLTVWIVEVDGVRLVIEAVRTRAGSDALDDEIHAIVDSTRFE